MSQGTGRKPYNLIVLHKKIGRSITMTINNIKLVPNNQGGWLVKGDTARFGIQEVLYESPFIVECITYIQNNGYSVWDVITFKHEQKKSHYIIEKKETTCFGIAFLFGLLYCGDEGEVLEIVPL